MDDSLVLCEVTFSEGDELHRVHIHRYAFGFLDKVVHMGKEIGDEDIKSISDLTQSIWNEAYKQGKIDVARDILAQHVDISEAVQNIRTWRT